MQNNLFNNILKSKTCWITYSYKQKKGLHYLNVFVALIKLISYKDFKAIRVKMKFCIQYIDMITAFV